MANRISDELIDRIREANDIVDVISEHVQLKRAGGNFKGLCPFHQEKTPSFNVNPARQIYHCFGCGVGGNAITFLMEYEKIGFVDALRELAHRAGIALPDRRSERIDAEDDPAVVANQMALAFYRSCLEGDAGTEARNYVKKRALGSDVMSAFAIGYAPAGWDNLLKAARRKGVADSALVSAGLVVERDGGGFYDRFRERLIFPLLSSGNRPVGFGGRSLGDQEPKYLNSPETHLYRKSYYLYGLSQARQAIRLSREAILVEGYMDLLSLHQAGFHNVVASAGTALTDEQARTIAKYADKVFIAYDGDKAGISAATRAAETLVQLGLKVRVAAFPGGEDPDSYVRQAGADALREVLTSSQDFIDFYVSLNPTDDSDDREKAARNLIETVVGIEDSLKAELMLEKISTALSLRPAAVARVYERRRAERQLRGRGAQRLRGRAREHAPGSVGGNGRQTAGPDASPGSTGRQDEGVGGYETAGAHYIAQKGLLGLLLAGGEGAERVRSCLEASDLTHPEIRMLAERILAGPASEDPIDIAALVDPRDDRSLAVLLTELTVLDPVERDGGRLCDDYIGVIRKAQIEGQIRDVDKEIRAAELTGDEERATEAIIRRQELAQLLSGLSSDR